MPNIEKAMNNHFLKDNKSNEVLTVCTLVKEGCESGTDIKFIELYYCVFYPIGTVWKYVLFIPIGLLLLFISMYNLASTSDEYLSTSIEYMVNKFKISESLAGVTLMALGSGAPDVFSSIAAASSSTPDNDSGFVGENFTPACSLLGSCVFLTSFVITLIGWVSENR